MSTPRKLIDVTSTLPTPVRRLSPIIERIMSIHRVNQAFDRVAGVDGSAAFLAAGLEALGIHYHVTEVDMARIPVTGPLVVVSNHPYGGIDGMVLLAIMLRVRPDAMVLGNELLQRIPQIRDRVIPVHVFGGHGAAQRNLSGIKAALRHVKAGGALIAFPSGAVSHFHVTCISVIDPQWSPHLGAIIRRTEASALPVFFSGRNSLLFQSAGLLHPRLRTAMLPRELVNKKNNATSAFAVRIGRPIPWKKLAVSATDMDRTLLLRERCYFMKNRDSGSTPVMRRYIARLRRKDRLEAIAPAVPPRLLAEEIAALPPSSLLATATGLSVYVAEAGKIPNCLQEIGRLREITFRGAGEGTGRPADIDRFDDTYQHLFLWNARREEIAGAYRMGLADDIVAKYGIRGLYTSTLFRYRSDFPSALGAAIELGRSFIRPEYQVKHHSLPLLWKGIAAFVKQHPHYTKLFGPVSISQDYQRLSRDLMVSYLSKKRMDENLARLVSARTPARSRQPRRLSLTSLADPFYDAEEVSILVSEIENDGKGIPVLLKHYLKLDAALLSFNLDRAFSNVVDGLIMVDLVRTEARIVKRFLGEEGYRAMMAHHNRPSPENDGWLKSA
ncbi:MAG: lysophospholipid acyltransferase family protein [Pseudomonadota bacterium]